MLCVYCYQPVPVACPFICLSMCGGVYLICKGREEGSVEVQGMVHGPNGHTSEGEVKGRGEVIVLQGL